MMSVEEIRSEAAKLSREARLELHERLGEDLAGPRKNRLDFGHRKVYCSTQKGLERPYFI